MRDAICRVIDEWDPIDLFPGAPADEYAEEIAAIKAVLSQTSDPSAVAAALRFEQEIRASIFTLSSSWATYLPTSGLWDTLNGLSGPNT